MKIAEFSIKNSLLVNLVSVFIILVGLYAMMNLRREAFPQVEYDILTVTTVYPGAPTEDVEKFVTIPIEKELKAVSGLEKITSTSDEGLSSIGIYIDPETHDKKKVIDDVQRAVDRVSTLPSEIDDDPEVFELATREFPVIEISLSGDVGEAQRRIYAEALEDKLTDVDGVAQIRKYGWRDPEVWVEVNPEKLKEYHVSIEEVMAALRTQNVTIPGGQLTTDTDEFNVRTTGEFRTKEEIENVIIRANDSGNWLKVKDVAGVRETFEKEVTVAKVNSERATAMVVLKNEQADAINVVNDVKKVLEDFRKTIPEELKVTTTNDFSYYVKRRLGVLQNNGVIGFVLVLVILFLFLDPIPAFMTAVGIPVAMFLSFLVMSILGININLVSMLGLLLVLGMLVDDGIIVAENVYRYVEEGMEPRAAAIKGTNEVAGPVTVTILTTFAAFAPLMFMEDIIGKFIKEIPMVVIITLSASLFEAFIILPSHLADMIAFSKRRQKEHKPHKEKRWYVVLKNLYSKSLMVALKGRYVVMAMLIGVFLFSIWVAKTQLKMLLFAGEGIEYVWVRAEAKKGTPLEKMEELVAPVEAIIRELPEDELDSYRTYIGAIQTEQGAFDPNAKRGSHL
ncbi:MAG: efflux RND transporter permease subunit, partial [Candidatus Omnitrophica bacterium]|nr:efflux RND transporter permease subunit [Candidatus Omnitrophota bacterium]